MAKRVLVTGLSSFWGGKLAQTLEKDPAIEAIIGVSPDDPTCELERTEFVRVGTQHALLRRIVQAAEIDTVVDSRLIVDSTTSSARAAHEANVIGTMNILAACSGPDSPVRKVVFKSSAHYYGCEQDDPAFFTERMQRPHPPHTRIERDIVEAEKAVLSFAERNREVTVTTLRFVNGLGPDLRTGHTRLLSLPVVPGILGFDPRYQFIHEDDIVGVLEHAVREELPGVYNAAADGVLVLSEIAGLLGKPFAPLLPPWGTGLAAAPLGTARPEAVARDAQPAALRPRARQPQAQGRGSAAAPHHARDRAGAGGASADRRDQERRGRAVPLRAGSRGVPALQPERPAGYRAGRRALRAERQQTCSTSSGYGPRSTIVRQVRSRSFFIVAAVLVLLLVAAGGVYAYDSGREHQIAKGISVGGVDVGGLQATDAEQRLRRVRAREAQPSRGRHVPRQALHADPEAGPRRRRHRRLDLPGPAPLALGQHLRPHLAQPARHEPERGPRPRHLLQPRRDPQAGQARQHHGRQAGGRRARQPRGGRHHPAAVNRRPGGPHREPEVLAAALPALDRRRPQRARAHEGGQAQGHHRRAREEVSGRRDRQPRRLQAHALQGPQARQDLRDRGRRRSGSRRPPGSTTCRTRR